MTVQNLDQQTPFTTRDGSTIRSILDRTNAPVQQQSLAEATLPASASTQRHYHDGAKSFISCSKAAAKWNSTGKPASSDRAMPS